jgi:hypothetical protein
MRALSVSGVLVAALVTGWAISPRAQTATPPTRRLDLKFNDGKVTLIAQGVTAREIMAEWAKQCGCLVQGTDRLPAGSTLPVQFEDQPEGVVLESLLRGAGGYLLGPRAPGSKGASLYGSVAVFPLVRGTATASYTSPSPVAAPLVTGGSPDDEIPPVTPVANPQTPAQTPPSPGRPGGPAPGPTTPTTPTGPGRGRGTL